MLDEEVAEKLKSKGNKPDPRDAWDISAYDSFLNFDDCDGKTPIITLVLCAAVVVNILVVYFIPQHMMIANWGFDAGAPFRKHGLTILSSFFVERKPFPVAMFSVIPLFIYGQKVECYLGMIKYVLLIAVSIVFAEASFVFHQHDGIFYGAAGGVWGVLAFYFLRFFSIGKPYDNEAIESSTLKKVLKSNAAAFSPFCVLMLLAGVADISRARWDPQLHLWYLNHFAGIVGGLLFWLIFEGFSRNRRYLQ